MLPDDAVSQADVREVGLSGRIEALLRAELDSRAFSAASCRIQVDGRTVASVDLGWSARVDAGGAEIPVEERESIDESTLFDLASLTKVFSAHTLLRLVQDGRLELDQPIGRILPEYRAGDKRRVTLRHLLTHTSGLPATWDGWRPRMSAVMAGLPAGGPAEPFTVSPLAARREELVADLLATPLTAAPGDRWEYACTGYNTAMVLAERATSKRWADLVHEETLLPLGLDEVGFSPQRTRAAATEYLPEWGRGTIRGDVHDESSWSLGGECANAGLFATSDGVLRLTEAIRQGRTQILGELMWENQLPAVLGRSYALDGDNRYGASLGLRIGELPWMGAGAEGFRGHNGFTGTSLQTDRERGLSVVLLTNRVHPTRTGPSTHPLRAAIAEAALGSLPATRS